MLTVATTRNVLCRAFSAKRVRGCFDAMRAAGIIRRGDVGRNGSARITLHDAMLALCVVALDIEGDSAAALQLAMRVRSWRAVDIAPGYRLAPGRTIDDVSDVRLGSLLIAQIQTRRPSSWLFSPVECVGAGLALAPAGNGPVPARIARRYCSVGEAVIAELGALDDPLENQRWLAILLLDRVARAVRLAPVRAERQMAEAEQ